MNESECPIQKKDELIVALKKAIAEVTAFCTERGVGPLKVLSTSPKKFNKAAEVKNAAMLLVDAQINNAF